MAAGHTGTSMATAAATVTIASATATHDGDRCPASCATASVDIERLGALKHEAVPFRSCCKELSLATAAAAAAVAMSVR